MIFLHKEDGHHDQAPWGEPYCSSRICKNMGAQARKWYGWACIGCMGKKNYDFYVSDISSYDSHYNIS